VHDEVCSGEPPLIARDFPAIASVSISGRRIARRSPCSDEFVRDMPEGAMPLLDDVK